MLAEKNAYIAEAASTLYELNQDEKIRLQCEAREDYYRQQASIQYEMDRREAKLEELTVKNQALLAEKESWAIEREQLLAQIAANKN